MFGNESAWFALLLGAALKSTIVLGAAWIFTLFLRRRSSAARHLVWTAAAAALLALPALSLFLPALRVNSRALEAVAPTFRVTVFANGQPEQVKAPAATVTRAAPATPWGRDVQTWMPRLWAAGSLLGLIHMLIAWSLMRRIERTSLPFRDSGLFFSLAHSLDIQQDVALVELPAGSMPTAFGILRPAVFLPSDAHGWSEDRRRVVLLHELAHVKRGDIATNLLMRTALCLFWWNPLAWMAWRESVQERERAADDLVLTAGENATGYAGHLLEIARSMQSATPVAWAALSMARPSQLEGRLLAILDSRMRRGSIGAPAALAAGLLAVGLVAPFAAIQAQEKLDPVTAPIVDATIRTANAQANHDISDAAAAAFEVTNKYDAAQKLLENSLAIRAKNSGEASSAYAIGLMKLGDLSAKRGMVSDAIDFYTRAIALGDTPETAGGLVYLASRAMTSGDLVTAGTFADRALAVAPKGLMAFRALSLKGDIAVANGQDAAAAAQYQKALAQDPPKSPELNGVFVRYAAVLKRQGRDAEVNALQAQVQTANQGYYASVGANPGAARIAVQPQANGTYKVGGGVSAPVLLRRTTPEYTEEARAAKVNGTVTLYVQIDPTGRATNIRVLQSLDAGLDEKAIEAVSQWQFKPGMREGVPVTVEATIEVNFKLL